MQHRQLIPHPSTPSKVVDRIEATVRVESGTVHARFRIVGDLSRVVVPPQQPPKRQDELWRHTCCELFLSASESDDYYEFNFAPSTAWAAYRFSGYRTGMAAAEVSGPEVTVGASADSLELDASIHLRECLGLKGDVRCALSCVLEERGRISYWALAHPTAQPDFHHRESFTVDLQR